MTDDSLSRMAQAMGFREEQASDISEQEAARSAPRYDQVSPAAPAAEPGNNNNNNSMDDELEAVLAQSRASAESEARARRQREDEAFERALAASSSVEGQQLSEAERYAQEERDLLKALELSQIGSAGPYDGVAGEGSSGTSHLTDLQLNGGTSTPMPAIHTGPSQLTAEHTGSTAIASMRQVQSGSPVLPTSPSPPLPPSSVHRTSSHKSGHKPLPLPPNGNVLQPETPGSSPPPSITSPSIHSRLPNPFDDCMSIAEVPQESEPGFGTPPTSIPYNHAHQALPFDAYHYPRQQVSRQKVPRVTSTSSFASGPSLSEGSHGGLHEWPQNPSSSTFDLESSQDSHGDNAEQLRESEKVSDDVLIGFPRLAPLSSGRVFPQVVQVSAEPGLETFSIQAKSYRSLITYLCWNADCHIISDQGPDVETAVTAVFEFFGGTQPPCLRFSLSIDQHSRGAKPLPPAPTHRAGDKMTFRSEIPHLMNLPMSAYALAQQLQTILKSARLCCDKGGGALYDLNQAADKLARQHGEKGPGAEEPDVADHCNRFKRLRKRVARASMLPTSSSYYASEPGSAHAATSSANGISEHYNGGSGSSRHDLSSKAERTLRKLKAKRREHKDHRSSVSSSGHGEPEANEYDATELRDEAFFVTPFRLPGK